MQQLKRKRGSCASSLPSCVASVCVCSSPSGLWERADPPVPATAGESLGIRRDSSALEGWWNTRRESEELLPLPSQSVPWILSLQNVDQHLFTLPQGYGQFAFGIFDDSFEFPFGSNVQSEDNRDSENRREREHQSRHRYGARQPRARLATRRASGRHEGVPTLEGWEQQPASRGGSPVIFHWWEVAEDPPVPRAHQVEQQSPKGCSRAGRCLALPLRAGAAGCSAFSRAATAGQLLPRVCGCHFTGAERRGPQRGWSLDR